jgi:cell wall assembly regulator SMI1
MSDAAADDGVSVLLGRLERWLAKHRRKYRANLPPGASPVELAELEKQLGKPLPADLRSLLAWHNGQGDEFIGAFEEDWLLMDSHAIAANRNDLLQDPDLGWSPDWIPFLDNDAGDFLFLDTSQAGAPVRNFCLGQADHPLLAAALVEWLRDFVENVEQEKYVEDPERGRFMRRHGV